MDFTYLTTLENRGNERSTTVGIEIDGKKANRDTDDKNRGRRKRHRKKHNQREKRSSRGRGVRLELSVKGQTTGYRSMKRIVLFPFTFGNEPTNQT